MYQAKEIVLVPCPYTDDPTVEKLRPLLILSKESHNRNENCLFGLVLTSSPTISKKFSKYLIELTEKDINGNKLKYKSFVLTDMPYATYLSQIKGTFGKVTNLFFKNILEKFKECIEEENCNSLNDN